jgi:glycosyltransferase involved in cell wall biosynthesis
MQKVPGKNIFKFHLAKSSASDFPGLSKMFTIMKLKIAIAGCRGVPNYYGGFEQLAEYLSVGLVNKGHEVTVYNSHNHPYQCDEFYGVHIEHCFDPEYKMGTAGQFIYDWNCIRHSSKQNFDVILFLGYTSNTVWGHFFPKKPVIITNMDGFEWKRAKYNSLTRQFLKQAEKWAIQFSDYYIADSVIIQNYLQNKYKVNCQYIPYGSEISQLEDESLLAPYHVSTKDYFLLMARMEPENNIETILNGFYKSPSDKKFVVVGNTDNSFGQKMEKKFRVDDRIVFAGAVFDKAVTHTLKYNSHLYFHGHSVGGTNPSLLEAMGSGALIAAHHNEFNHSVLQRDAYYFENAKDVEWLIKNVKRDDREMEMVHNNFLKIEKNFNWPGIIDHYNSFIIECYKRSRK